MNTTEKPLELYEHFILGFSKPGDVLVDLGSGSGTFICAALRCSRACVAFESDSLQIDASANRFAEVLATLKSATNAQRIEYLSVSVTDRKALYQSWCEAEKKQVKDDQAPPASQSSRPSCPTCGEFDSETKGKVEHACIKCSVLCHKGCLNKNNGTQCCQ